MKVVVIGGNPAGLSAASAIRRAHPDWNINVYEKGQYISYGSCGIPYYVADKVKELAHLMTLTKEDLEKKRKIPVHLFHEVIKVDFDNKNVIVRDIQANKEFQDEYDYLVIATGGKAKELDSTIGITHHRLVKVHTMDDAKVLKKLLINNRDTIRSVVIIGAGYIGLEMIESYKARGITNITIVGPRLVFRSETQNYVKRELENNGIKIIYSRVTNIEPISEVKLRVTLINGEILEADLVQLSAGVVPSTDFLKDSGLEMLPNGAIITDDYMRTNIPNVYAAGDCVATYHRILKKKVYVPLAPAANKQGRIAGSHIAGKKVDPFPGIVGTSIFKVLNLYCARTGITIEQAKKLGYDVQFTKIETNEIAHYYPGVAKMSVMLIYDPKSHLLLGGEITSPSPIGAKKIDVLATALYAQFKIDDLQKLDLSYAPPFSPVWDPLLIAANVARKKCQ